MKPSEIQVDYNHCIITGLAMLKSARRIMVGAFYSFKNDLPDAKAVFLSPSWMIGGGGGGWKLQLPPLLTSRYLREGLALVVFIPIAPK